MRTRLLALSTSKSLCVALALCGLSWTSAFLPGHVPRSASSLPAKRGKGGKGGGGGSKMKQPPGRIVPAVEFVDCEPDGTDAWRCLDIAQLLQKGGCGVVPTDTGYGLVTMLDSRDGLERLLRIKGLENCKKPLSLLCADLNQSTNSVTESTRRSSKR